MQLKGLLSRADVTRTGSYHFDDPDEKVVKFPEKAEEILEDRRKYERMMVEARAEVDLALNHYNSITDAYNESGRAAAQVLRDTYGLVAHPALKPKLDLAGPEAHGIAPPTIPEGNTE